MATYQRIVTRYSPSNAELTGGSRCNLVGPVLFTVGKKYRVEAWLVEELRLMEGMRMDGTDFMVASIQFDLNPCLHT
jgi:hypothetical protein